MKVVFVGPSLPVLSTPSGQQGVPGLSVAPPARQGDISRALDRGATEIGLIDGLFEQVPAVWHKEILFALSCGIPVYGAASMGALRAAECAVYGMVPVGSIALQYARGERIDDADVAQIHGPEELGYPPLSEPLVNVDAVLAAALASGQIERSEHSALLATARDLFFKRRTWKAIIAGIRTSRADALLACLSSLAAIVNPKRDDAAELVAGMTDGSLAARFVPRTGWTLQHTAQMAAARHKLYY